MNENDRTEKKRDGNPESTIGTVSPRPIDDPFAVFTEWAGEADARAYASLSPKNP